MFYDCICIIDHIIELLKCAFIKITLFVFPCVLIHIYLLKMSVRAYAALIIISLVSINSSYSIFDKSFALSKIKQNFLFVLDIFFYCF